MRTEKEIIEDLIGGGLVAGLMVLLVLANIIVTHI